MNLITYGRCRCRCECTNTATLHTRLWMARRGWLSRLLNHARSKWVPICVPCAPHIADQIAETGRIWRP